MEYSLPKTNKMPDLSDIDIPATTTYLINSLAGINRGVSNDLELYRRSLVRLTDKAIIEYGEVRDSVELQVNDRKGTLYVVSIINHLENCINSMKRALNFLDKIKRHADAIPLDKLSIKYLSAHSDTLRHLRDAIEHADADIQKEKINTGNPITISISEDASQIGVFEHVFSTYDLATVLRKMHELSVEIAKFGINDTSKNK